MDTGNNRKISGEGLIMSFKDLDSDNKVIIIIYLSPAIWVGAMIYAGCLIVLGVARAEALWLT